MTGAASKRKGSAFERHIVQFFTAMGWYAKRVPLSGAADGFKGDVQTARSQEDWNAGRKWVVECKRWQAGMKTIRRYLPQGGILIHKADYEEAVVIMSAATFRELVQR